MSLFSIQFALKLLLLFSFEKKVTKILVAANAQLQAITRIPMLRHQPPPSSGVYPYFDLNFSALIFHCMSTSRRVGNGRIRGRAGFCQEAKRAIHPFRFAVLFLECPLGHSPFGIGRSFCLAFLFLL